MKKPIPNYYRRLIGTIIAMISIALLIDTSSKIHLTTLLVGSFLWIEHCYQWGFQFWDFLGHEWLGLILILIVGAYSGTIGLIGIGVILLASLILIDMDREKQTNNRKH